MAATVEGRINWSTRSDKDGHRDHFITWLVSTDDPDDGPYQVSFATGLPAIGAPWVFGNDNDPWAFCWPTIRIEEYKKRGGDPHQWWTARQVFSTKPLERCQDTTIENPVNEPPKISGSFTKFVREQYLDRNGDQIMSSSFELFRGSAVEFDENRPTVRIEQNYGTQQLPTFSPMIDTVNDAALWGLSPRMIKLSNAPWERVLFGTCSYYWRVMYEFDVNFNTFDRFLVDEGLMIVDPDIEDPEAIDPKTGQAYYLDPKNYVRNKDAKDENAQTVQLNGKGSPRKIDEPPVNIKFERYSESNFLLLGIPTDI